MSELLPEVFKYETLLLIFIFVGVAASGIAITKGIVVLSSYINRKLKARKYLAPCCCKDCIYYEKYSSSGYFGRCLALECATIDDGFCWKAKKKEGG